MKDWRKELKEKKEQAIKKASASQMLKGETLWEIYDWEALETFIDQLISERDKEIIKMLENTDVQMSVNGDVSQDEIAMARFIYKAHIKHIIKKIGSAIIPPNPINGTLPSETDSATK